MDFLYLGRERLAVISLTDVGGETHRRLVRLGVDGE
jgi:hypothetical protein